jgi:uncharacterized protein YabE (DUF348 family)
MHTVEFIGLNPSGGDNTAFVDEVAFAETSQLSDGSFEVPGLAADTFQYAPGGSPWQFTGEAGICSNGSTFGNPNAPDGSQAAFLETNGSMSESVYLDTGTYSVSFMAAQQSGQQQYQEIQVLVDGAQVATVTPTSTGYALYQTQNFPIAAGMHTIEFLGASALGGDNTAFIDEAAIAAIGISDGSFEVPGLAASTFQYQPTGSPWQFTGTAGVCSNGSAFGNPAAPDGSQAALLQSTCSISQSVYLNAGTYNLSFMAAQRAGQKHYQEFTVLVDGALVGTVTPIGTTYESYETSNFTVATGTHTVQFIGFNPLGGDNTAFVDEVAISSTADSISDGSFEVPALAAKTSQYAPNGSPWQFTGAAGVCSNGSAFGNPAAPDGSQVAFLQSNGSMSESIYLDAGTYSFSFMAAQRAGQKNSQEFQVLVDGAQVGMVTPAGTTYESYETSNFTVAAGTHTVQFIGFNPSDGDNTAFVDEVALSSTVGSINDGSFETPALAANTFQYAPIGSPWQFTGEAGVCSNGSTLGNPNAPDGSQAAFLETNGSMSESGTYSLSFMAAQRAGEPQYQEFEVLVDGAEVGTVTPTGTAYAWYQTPNFTVAVGLHTIEFLGLNPQGGDNTAFIDEVQTS